MKKFVRKILVFILLLIIAVLSINYIYIKRHISYEDKFNKVPNNIEICNLGSSHGTDSFDYEKYQNMYVCFNFADSAQSLTYDYRILKHYKQNISTGAVIYIVVSYRSLYGMDETKKEDFESLNKRYYTFLKKDEIKKFDEKTYIYTKVLPSLDAGEMLLPTLFGFVTSNSENESNGVLNHNMALVQSEKKYNDQISNFFDKNGKLIINNSEISAMYKIVKFCKENNFNPIVITTPYLYEFTAVINSKTPELIENFDEQMKKLVDTTGVIYWDYSRSEKYSGRYPIFENIDHLNNDGALIFTKEVVDRYVEQERTGY